MHDLIAFLAAPLKFNVGLPIETSWMEIGATVFTLLSIYLTIIKRVALYPVGIVGTLLFIGVFASAKLYSSMALNIYFTAIQAYGWWFWLRGDHGKAPPVRAWPSHWIGLAVGVLVALTYFVVGPLVAHFTGAKVASLDAVILGLSIGAQFLLDRKVLQNWWLWIVVDVISIYVYFHQGLNLAGLTYVVCLIMAILGMVAWNRGFREKAT